MVFWLIGLSGAGKTHIGKALASSLKHKQSNVIFLDGDIIRTIIGDNLGYDLEARKESGWRICRLCQYLDSQGMIVVCSVISLFKMHREWNRENYSSYFQVFVDVDTEELKSRDPKGLYSAFARGEVNHVAGLDLPFERPTDSDMIIRNSQPFQDPNKLAEDIIRASSAIQQLA